MAQGKAEGTGQRWVVSAHEADTAGELGMFVSIHSMGICHRCSTHLAAGAEQKAGFPQPQALHSEEELLQGRGSLLTFAMEREQR